MHAHTSVQYETEAMITPTVALTNINDLFKYLN